MTDVIEVSGLRKSFGRTRALDGLDLRVRAGEVHGFLGPNGAGKTTTIRILLGLLRADGGAARLLGGDPWHDATSLHRRLAYVPGDVTLWPNLTGGEVIDLLGRLRGGLDEKRRAALVERFELDPKKRARAYSKGNRQKVALIAALASDAELLILDEPTAGLDPLMEAAFRACVEDERRAGRSVLLSSHILSEVEALCERVTIIRAGAHGGVRHAGRAAPSHPHLDHGRAVHRRRTAWPDCPACTTWTSRAPGCGARWTAENLGDFLSRLTEAGVRSLESHPPSLEELFLRHYTDDATGVTAGSAEPVTAAVPARRSARPLPDPADTDGPSGRTRPGPRRPEPPMRALAGTGPLTSLALRRDRIMLAAWIYVLTAWVVGTAYSLKKLYPTAAAQQRFAATVAHNALFDALYDPLFGRSLGALTAWRISSPTALLAGLMSVFIVVRHTRADEEAGRLELVGAASVGRQAALASALLVAFGASIVFAALTAAGLIFLGLPAAGAFGLGLAIASAGWVFAAVTADRGAAGRDRPCRPRHRHSRGRRCLPAA